MNKLIEWVDYHLELIVLLIIILLNSVLCPILINRQEKQKEYLIKNPPSITWVEEDLKRNTNKVVNVYCIKDENLNKGQMIYCVFEEESKVKYKAVYRLKVQRVNYKWTFITYSKL